MKNESFEDVYVEGVNLMGHNMCVDGKKKTAWMNRLQYTYPEDVEPPYNRFVVSILF